MQIFFPDKQLAIEPTLGHDAMLLIGCNRFNPFSDITHPRSPRSTNSFKVQFHVCWSFGFRTRQLISNITAGTLPSFSPLSLQLHLSLIPLILQSQVAYLNHTWFVAVSPSYKVSICSANVLSSKKVVVSQETCFSSL